MALASGFIRREIEAPRGVVGPLGFGRVEGDGDRAFGPITDDAAKTRRASFSTLREYHRRAGLEAVRRQRFGPLTTSEDQNHATAQADVVVADDEVPQAGAVLRRAVLGAKFHLLPFGVRFQLQQSREVVEVVRAGFAGQLGSQPDADRVIAERRAVQGRDQLGRGVVRDIDDGGVAEERNRADAFAVDFTVRRHEPQHLTRRGVARQSVDVQGCHDKGSRSRWLLVTVVAGNAVASCTARSSMPGRSVA